MSTNSKNMTLEERIVQNIKDEKLFALIGDEDAITELTRRALREALFQNRRERTGEYSWNDKERDSPVVEAAREQATIVAKEVARELLTDPEVRQKINEALSQLLPVVLMDIMRSGIKEVADSGAHKAFAMVSAAVQNRSLTLPPA